ncbi:MAG: hypothetical protein F6K30_22845 [Cyanothece sp. SIO2G6]|nr:hypothetical protein [Cyanothece sp. SIO2G6]
MYTQWELALNPYLSLGLERNPFANCAEPNGSDRFWLDRGWSDAPKIRAKQVVQIIAPQGFGKTSHLQHWRSQTSGPHCYYPPGLERFKLPPIGPINGLIV